MTDLELIELARQKTPQEWSLEEIVHLRLQLGESAELRRVLLEELRLRPYLEETLLRIGASVDEAVQSARPPRRASTWIWAAAVAGALTGALLAAVVLLVIRGNKPDVAVAPEVQPSPARHQGDAETDVKEEPPIPPGGSSGDESPVQADRPSDQEPSPSTAEAGEPTVAATAWNLEDPPRPFRNTCFDDFGEQDLITQYSRIRAWFAPLEGQDHQFLYETTVGTQFGIDGIVRLAAPWPSDAALRFDLLRSKGLKIHFWKGSKGVTLQYHVGQSTRSWAAYAATRQDQEDPRPADTAILSTDRGRFQRSAEGTVRLCWQERTLVLSRGDLRLLTVPMGQPPEEVIFEGEAWFRGISMFRSGPVPEEVRKPGRCLFGRRTPADMPWEKHLAGMANLRKLPDGSVQLVCKGNVGRPSVALPFPSGIAYEIILQLDEPKAGTGVYLADDSAQPLVQVHFFQGAKTRRTMFGLLSLTSPSTDPPGPSDGQPYLYAGRRQWLRLVLGSSIMRGFVSGDGIQWHEVADLSTTLSANPSQVGLYCIASDTPREIGLRRLEIREPAAVTALASRDLLRRLDAVAALHKATGDTIRDDSKADFGRWQQAVIDSVPEDTDLTAWRRACAVRTLRAGPAAPLAKAIWGALLEEIMHESTPPEQRLQLVDEIITCRDDSLSASSNPDFPSTIYSQFGRILAGQGHRQPYSFAWQALLRTPVRVQPGKLTIAPELLQTEILLGMQSAAWEKVYRLLAALRFWNPAKASNSNWGPAYAKQQPFLDWAYAVTLKNLPNRRKDKPVAMRPDWRYPVSVPVSRDAYNIMAEIRAALKDNSDLDACRAISSAGSLGESGLFADEQDARLFAPLDERIAWLMRERPKLQQTMIEKLGARGRVRINAALAKRDFGAVEAITVQFPGTSMAANAHQVLGDRSLEVGDFTTAIAYYQKALGCVEADQRENIAARLRLAAAMLGRRAGQPVTQPVDFGNRQIAAAEFEEIVSRLLKRNSDSTPDVAEAPRAARAAVAPAALAVQLWATLDSPMGQSPEAIPASHASTDWVARQTAATISGDTMFVSNRFQVAAYELSTGKKQWTHSTAGEAGSTHAWTLVSMRPVLAGQRVFVRRLTKDGPDLACLDAATGAIQWHTCKAGKVVADPLLARGMVIVLTQLVDTIGAFSRLQLTAFDPDSGKVNFQSFLVQLRGDQVDGQLAAAGELLVISVEGSVLCCDLRGRVRWLRKRLWIPTSVRSDTLDAPMQPYHRPPLVADGRLYVSQPGAPSVACLDLETGRVHWRRTLPGAIRLLGLHDGRLVVQTLAGFEALETKTGKTLWLHAVEAILDAHLGGLPGGLVYAALEPRRDGRKRPRMVWLDPAAGHPFGQWPLEQPTGKQPALGPLLFNANRVWAFGSQDGSKPERKIIELVSSGPAIAGHIPNPTLAHWANVPAHVQQAVSTVLPGWTLLSTDQDAQVGRHAELQGRREVLVTAASGSTALLARRVAVPPTGDAKLRLEVAGKSGATLKIHVRAAGRTFLETSLETSDWRQFDVDLSPLAGRTVWLCVVHEPPEEGTSYAYWQRMEIQATRHKER